MTPFLIDDRYLTENTNIATSMKDKKLKVALQTVTVINVKPLLGLPLYALLENYVANGTSLSDKQTELFNQVAYYMALRVERELMYDLLNLNNKGATTDQNAADMALVTAKRQDVEAKSDFLRNGILAYLDANRADFPEFYPEPNSTTPNPGMYSSGIVFDYAPKRYFQ